MTNSVANNGNPLGSADYARNRILNTGIDIWEYEGGYSYHGKFDTASAWMGKISVLIKEEEDRVSNINCRR